MSQPPPMRQANPVSTFDLGAWIGRGQAFSFVANHCSAAGAECLARIEVKSKPANDMGMIGRLAASWGRVCLRPWTPVFSAEIHGKSHVQTLLGVAAGSLVGFLLSWVAHLLAGQSREEFMGLAAIWVKSGTPAPFASWSVLVPLGVVVGFYDVEIALFIVARLLGGKGSFGTQTYLQSLFYAPLAIVQQVFAVTPIAARPLFALAAICSLIPTTTSLKAAHGYSTVRAVLTWAAPVVLNIVAIAAVVALASRGH